MWQGIIGHDDVVDRFRRSIQAGRLASTYLFTGSPGIGKKRFALELAHTLLCANEVDADLQPCGRCESCRMFVAGNHPDLEVVGLPPDKTTLPIELFIGDREHRNQEGLCHRLGLRPFFGRRKVAIVDDADHFGIASANCLLKTLEEPPPSAMLILIGTSPSRQLPTIRSRSQIVRFRTLPMEDVATILIGTGATSDRDFAVQIAQLSDGSTERAMQLTDSTLWEFRDRLYAALQIARLDSVRLTRLVQPFVDEAGKETSQRRERLRIVIGFVIERYQQSLRSGAASEARWATQALDACLSALEQIDRNANLGLVIQIWCEGLTGGIIRNAVGPLAFASAPH